MVSEYWYVSASPWPVRRPDTERAPSFIIWELALSLIITIVHLERLFCN